MNAVPASAAERHPAPTPPELPAPADGWGVTRAAVQAILIAMLAWTVLLCAGLGGSVGVVSQTLAGKLAGKLAASAQYLQRQGSSSLTSRSARRELPAVAGELKVEGAERVMVDVEPDGVMPVGEIAPPRPQPHTDALPDAATQPTLSSRHRTPPSRAPPLPA